MHFCYDNTLFTKLVVHTLLTPKLFLCLAQDLEKLKNLACAAPFRAQLLPMPTR